MEGVVVGRVEAVEELVEVVGGRIEEVVVV